MALFDPQFIADFMFFIWGLLSAYVVVEAWKNTF